jgi:hypothetical protein
MLTGMNGFVVLSCHEELASRCKILTTKRKRKKPGGLLPLTKHALVDKRDNVLPGETPMPMMAKKLEKLLLDVQYDRIRETGSTLLQVRRVTFTDGRSLEIYYRENSVYIEEAYFIHKNQREKLNEEEIASLSVTY